jgi:uncharacterized protein YdaU (DUF1376 family)
MANKAPAFQFYAKDWLDMRVMRMSYEAQGVYMRILAHMWADSDTQFSIENDPKALSRMLGLSVKKFQKIFAEIQWPNDHIFIEEDGFLISKRLRKEKEKQVKISTKRSQAADNRWSKSDANAYSNAEQEQCKRHALQSSSSSSSSEKDKDLRNLPSDEGRSSTSPPDGGHADAPVQLEPETGQGQAREDSAPKRARGDDCPHREIIELFHETLPELPRVESWAADNQAQLKARWREDGKRQSLAWWGAFFRRVKASDFLCGQVAGREGRPFFATLSWLVKRANIGKVLNGQYDNRGPRTGSSLGDRNAMAAQMAIANRRQHAGS